MKCPLCNIEMRISLTTTEVEGDTNAEEKTAVYQVQHLVCRNSHCQGFEKEQTRVRHLIYRGE